MGSCSSLKLTLESWCTAKVEGSQFLPSADEQGSIYAERFLFFSLESECVEMC